MKMKFCLTVSTNGVSTRLYYEWNTFCFFGSGSDMPESDWRKNSPELEMVFLFRSRDSFFLQTNVTAKQLNCRFLVLTRNIQNMTAGFALFAVVETSRFVG